MLLKTLIENRALPYLLSGIVLKFLSDVPMSLADAEEYDRVWVRSLKKLQYMAEEDLNALELTFEEFPVDFLASMRPPISVVQLALAANTTAVSTTATTSPIGADGAAPAAAAGSRSSASPAQEVLEAAARVGAKAAVTVDNVREYIDCKVRYELEWKRRPALEAIRRGFLSGDSLRPHLTLLSPVELQIALCGQQHINAQDIIGALDFAGFPEGSHTPQHLMEVLRNASQNNLRRFMRLCSSTVTLPGTSGGGRDGGSGVNGRAGARSGRQLRIKVMRVADTTRLPVGHTCAQQLDLPDYDDLEVLTQKLALSLAHVGDGFYLA
jgi:hypothetical protein